MKLQDVVNEYNQEAARAGAQALCLEDQLRASVARNERMQMAHEDLYEQIEKRRGELLERVQDLRDTRDNMNKQIKDAQDALDALPVPRVRRSPKKTVGVGGLRAAEEG